MLTGKALRIDSGTRRVLFGDSRRICLKGGGGGRVEESSFSNVQITSTSVKFYWLEYKTADIHLLGESADGRKDERTIQGIRPLQDATINGLLPNASYLMEARAEGRSIEMFEFSTPAAAKMKERIFASVTTNKDAVSIKWCLPGTTTFIWKSEDKGGQERSLIEKPGDSKQIQVLNLSVDIGCGIEAYQSGKLLARVVFERAYVAPASMGGAWSRRWEVFLPPPENPQLVAGRLVWDSVLGASRYILRLMGFTERRVVDLAYIDIDECGYDISREKIIGMAENQRLNQDEIEAFLSHRFKLKVSTVYQHPGMEPSIGDPAEFWFELPK